MENFMVRYPTLFLVLATVVISSVVIGGIVILVSAVS